MVSRHRERESDRGWDAQDKEGLTNGENFGYTTELRYLWYLLTRLGMSLRDTVPRLAARGNYTLGFDRCLDEWSASADTKLP